MREENIGGRVNSRKLEVSHDKELASLLRKIIREEVRRFIQEMRSHNVPLVLSCINLHTYVLGDQGVLLSWSIRRVLHVRYVPG